MIIVETNLQSASQFRLVQELDRPVLVERLGDVAGEQQVEETALSLLGEDVLQWATVTTPKKKPILVTMCFTNKSSPS